jgi:uncharacterized membrane protein (UPF0127 family)
MTPNFSMHFDFRLLLRFPPRLFLGVMVLAAAGAALGPAADSSAAAPGMTQARVMLAGQEFVVDVAETPGQQSLGLGGRKRLASGEGMLFLYPDKATRTFWMKGMVISIDIIWLDNNRIVHIEHRVPPPLPGAPQSTLPTYVAPSPANGVLEIAEGRAAQLGLRVGDFARLIFN